jgi:hypothetical protein
MSWATVGGRPSFRETAYVVVVLMVAAAGFGSGTPWLILLSIGLALPAGLAALVAYYLAYGLLALVPGANASTSSGSGGVSADGTVVSSTSSSDLATWFAVLTPVLAVLLVAVAAWVNVLGYRSFMKTRRRPAVT